MLIFSLLRGTQDKMTNQSKKDVEIVTSRYANLAKFKQNKSTQARSEAKNKLIQSRRKWAEIYVG